MRFEKKDILLLIPATLLAVAGLGPDDPWVVGPCLLFSWVTFIVICVIHEGSRRTRAIVGLVITVVLFGVAYRRLNSIHHFTAETASRKIDEPKFETPAKDERSKSEALTKPKPIRPIKNPLEIVSFRSDYGISIENRGPLSVYTLSLLVKVRIPNETKSYALGFEIQPGKIYKQDIREGGLQHFRVQGRLADTWEEHFTKASTRYAQCGFQLSYFSPSDPSFLQIRAQGEQWAHPLGYDNISGILYYRVQGFAKTEQSTVPLVVTLSVNDDTCPRD